MAPWDENTFFDLPTCKNITVSNVDFTSILLANPHRVALFFATDLQGAANFIRLSFDGVNTAFILDQSWPIQTIRQSEFGPLPTMQWFALGNAIGLALSITQIVIHDWPLLRQSASNDTNASLEALIANYLRPNQIAAIQPDAINGKYSKR